MIKIGILSDTHAYLDEKIFDVFAEVDEIWHAGDIGSVEVIERLQAFKKCRLVFGNIDNTTIQSYSQVALYFELEGLKIYMNHYGGTPAKYDARAVSDLNKYHPNIFVCGHSHILRVLRDAKRDNMLFINPGAAGVHGFHKVKTCIRMTLDNGKIPNFEVIELGLRAK